MCRYGMFKQLIKDGYQAEVPDIWLEEGNPWEVKRNDVRFTVGFAGRTVTEKGKPLLLNPSDPAQENKGDKCGGGVD